MKVINKAGKKIILELSTMEAAIITEALRSYKTEESKKLVNILMNQQDVISED